MFAQRADVPDASGHPLAVAGALEFRKTGYGGEYELALGGRRVGAFR